MLQINTDFKNIEENAMKLDLFSFIITEIDQCIELYAYSNIEDNFFI